MDLLFVFLTWTTSLPYWTHGKERDREMLFPQNYFFAERRLVNHTIDIKFTEDLDQCELLCYLNDDCVSLNIKKDRDNGKHECELNNSTHLEHDIDLLTDAAFYYRGSKNACGKNSRCRNNATCQSGFTVKGYRCSCTSGFHGEYCEEDIDECETSSHNCHVNAICNNTNGSYVCTCNPGYTGDGRNCTDIDECAASGNACASGGTVCTNTAGSYHCTCQFGHFWDGTTCQVDVCQIHTILEDVDRDVNHVVQSSYKCDNSLTDQWYRFLNASQIRMPTTCPPHGSCGTQWPGWLKGAHPTVDEGIVRKEVCFHRNSDCCKESRYINVKNCGSFYVYKLVHTIGCSFRYCYTSN